MKENPEIYGMFCALQVAIRDINKTHPNHQELIAALHQEHEETIGLLTA
jgi:hypothetical protein